MAGHVPFAATPCRFRSFVTGRGIGTPATRADTIENLISKGYVMRAGRALRPSVKGIRLIDILERMNAERLASPGLTGELESHLADVEHGRMKAKSFMDEVYAYTKEIVDLTKGFEFEAPQEPRR